jgi:methionine-rich copper-binding protein CopC
MHRAILPSRPRHTPARALAPLAMAFGVLLALAFPAVASAHAKLHSSDPAAGAILTKAPTTITLTFEQNVDPSKSDIVVYDATNKIVSTGPATVDRTNTKQMRVSMQGNGSLTYLIAWHNVSLDDGDPDIGAFNIYIGNDAAPTSSTPSTPSSSGVNGGIVALIGILGLVIGGAGGFFFARRAQTSA